MGVQPVLHHRSDDLSPGVTTGASGSLLLLDVACAALVRHGGQPVWRDGCTTDNGNWILDVHGLRIVDPVRLEAELNQIAGVVTVGLFAQRPADVVLVGDEEMA